MKQDATGIVNKIAGSKKYNGIYIKTIEHIVKQCLERYDSREAEKKARNILHQIWGSYYTNKPDYSYLLDQLRSDLRNDTDIRDAILKILPAQSSTRERIPLLGFFYEHIFSVTGYPDSIIDHACGLNPLTIPWMNLPESTEYCAYDIDVCQIRFLNSVFNILGLPQGINIGSGDVILDRFGYSDIVFMLKLLPPLEHQSKGSSLKIMQNQECRKMVISFPVKSLSGNEKGMAEFYSGWFINLIKDKWKYKRLDFDTELVFIVEK